MSEQIKARLLLARFHSDTEPTIVAAVDMAIWEHWDEDEEAAWVKQGQRTFGLDHRDCEWSQVWAVFAPQDLVEAFATPEVPAGVIASSVAGSSADRKETGE
jgi:cupin superfamily acireductone dioxygenase involved in methionine salvage